MTGIGFKPCPVPWVLERTPTYRDFINDYPALAGFFTYYPARPQSVIDRAAELRQRRISAHGAAGERHRFVADALAAYNRRIGAGGKALENIALLGQGRAWAVVTGQQAGYLTGPLYTIHKAVTAVLLARLCRDLTGEPVVPVYWVAAEDHDYTEVAAATVFGPDLALREATLPKRRPDCVSAGHLPVPDDAPARLQWLADLFDRFPHTAEVVGFLRDTACRSASVAEWFARIMARLFAADGLVLLDPMLPALRRQLSGFFAEAWRRQDDIAQALDRQGRRLQECGYPAPFCPDPAQASVFVYSRGRRTALILDGTVYRERGGSGRWTVEQLIDLACSEPERFSPNAALRPVGQELLLPVLAHVSGPGEIAYLAQTGPLYELFGLTPPVFHPRISLTLTWPDASAELAGCGVGWEELAQGPGTAGELLRGVLAGRDDFGIERRFAAVRELVRSEYGRLVEDIGVWEPGLARLGATNLGRIMHQIDYLEEKAWQHYLRRNKTAAVLRKAERLLFPLGRLQEQVLNITPWLCRFGWGLAEMLLRAPLTAEHHLVLWERAG